MKIFYDGDCYFCKNYAEFAKLRSQVGDVELISLRSDHPDVKTIKELGFKVNRGFVVEHDNMWLEGDKAFSYLNLLMRGNGLAQKFLMQIAKRPRLSAVFYRFLVFGRYLVLAFQGLTLIDLENTSAPNRYRSLARWTRLGIALCFPLLLFSMVAHFAEGDRWAGLYTALVLAVLGSGYFWAIQRHEHVENLLRKLSRGRWKPFLVVFAIYLFVVNAGTPIGLRRFMGLFLSVPIWGLFIMYGLRAFRLTRCRNWLVWLPAAAFLFAAIPGLIVGPFYGGIAGWVIKADLAEPIRIGGYKLVNKQGQTHWLNHAIFQPHGQIGRFRHAFRAMDGSSEDAFLQFAFQTYTRIYPGIAAGHYPHQWALGDYAYPTHSLQKYDTEILARDFAPKDIVAIERVLEVYDHTGELLKAEVRKRYSIESLMAAPPNPQQLDDPKKDS